MVVLAGCGDDGGEPGECKTGEMRERGGGGGRGMESEAGNAIMVMVL